MVDVQRLREAKDALESVTIVLGQGWSDWHKDACIFLTEHAPALLAGLSELLAIAEASEGQPIDSAPKDGTLVIIGAAGHESVSARWGWEAPWIDGWWCDGHRSDAEGPNFTPTHWRPLPKAPTQQSAGDGV